MRVKIIEVFINKVVNEEVIREVILAAKVSSFSFFVGIKIDTRRTPLTRLIIIASE